ncbi:hypothetical protein [Streptomyces sp. NPDC127038]|uniref:hypothetical protein n=1 Tax=Streptomyces sp. NPDC127038 TaxID=3347114 RepID=UPI00365AD528
MRLLRRSRSARVDERAARIEALIEDRNAHIEEARATASALLRVSGELSVLKDVVAHHIAAASDPSSALTDAPSMAAALQHAFRARGVDLRIELSRMERRPL